MYFLKDLILSISISLLYILFLNIKNRINKKSPCERCKKNIGFGKRCYDCKKWVCSECMPISAPGLGNNFEPIDYGNCIDCTEKDACCII